MGGPFYKWSGWDCEHQYLILFFKQSYNEWTLVCDQKLLFLINRWFYETLPNFRICDAYCTCSIFNMFSFDVTDFSLLGLSTISVDNKAVTKWLSCKDIKRILIWEISLKILFRLWPRKKSEIFRRVFIWQLTFSPLKSVILTHQISNPNHPRFQNRGRHFENFNDPALITQFFVNPTRDTDIFYAGLTQVQ